MVKSELAIQLQGALDSRRIIEQAKGVLMGRQQIPAHTAFEQLRAQARAERRKVAAVCAEVVANAAPPPDEAPRRRLTIWTPPRLQRSSVKADFCPAFPPDFCGKTPPGSNRPRLHKLPKVTQEYK